MILTELSVSGLRCIEHAELEIPPGLALVCGDNGSGKTSLLESIFLLGRGRSFRTRNSERLIRHGRERLVVFGRTGDAARHASGAGGLDGNFLGDQRAPGQALGVQVSRANGTTARISGSTARSL